MNTIFILFINPKFAISLFGIVLKMKQKYTCQVNNKYSVQILLIGY